MLTDELILYRSAENRQLLKDMLRLCERDDTGAAYSCIHELVSLAGSYGFEGNLWQNYLTLLLVNDENVFSTSCEITGLGDGSLLEFARHDFGIFIRLFMMDFSALEEKAGSSLTAQILHFRRGDVQGSVYSARIRDRICSLSSELAEASARGDLDRFTDCMIRFYREFGVGKFGLHKAFRVEHDSEAVKIVPITNIAHVKLDDLVGYEIQKQKLIDNTEAFVEGRTANNCLLFGDAGTGKSSSVKGILNQYYDRGLRMIELYKHQFQDLNEVIAQIKNRKYRFIIFMDDLSFEDFEVEYKYLKAVIEGGLEKKPENVLIYATSNRRHLIREQSGDNYDGNIAGPAARMNATHGGDLHVSDTVQEKLSLSSRFGCTIYFGSPDKKEFQTIVRSLAGRSGIRMPEDELFLEANKWELSHGGLSGRTAQQFIDYLSAVQSKDGSL